MNSFTPRWHWLITFLTGNLKPQLMRYNMSTSTSWWRWPITLLSGIALWQVAGMLSSLAVLALVGDDDGFFGHFWPVSIYSVIRSMVVVIGMKYVWRIPQGDWASIGFTGQNFKWEALYGAAFGLALALLQYSVFLPLTGGEQRPNIIASAELMGTSPGGLIAAIILGWLVGGLAEEVFYRGHLIRSLSRVLGGKRWSLILSAIGSIALFSIGHGYQGWIGALSTGFVAIAYTMLFLWRGSLTAAIMAHGVYNTLAILGIYFLLR